MFSLRQALIQLVSVLPMVTAFTVIVRTHGANWN
jgi:hypothetical protein